MSDRVWMLAILLRRRYANEAAQALADERLSSALLQSQTSWQPASEVAEALTACAPNRIRSGWEGSRSVASITEISIKATMFSRAVIFDR
jgi:hypothetical protein